MSNIRYHPKRIREEAIRTTSIAFSQSHLTDTANIAHVFNAYTFPYCSSIWGLINFNHNGMVGKMQNSAIQDKSVKSVARHVAGEHQWKCHILQQLIE